LKRAVLEGGSTMLDGVTAAILTRRRSLYASSARILCHEG
jgi:hypothetical protein